MVISTKEKICKAALPLFAKKGYYGTTMNEIAEQVGLNKASIYFHYSGKEELFYAVYEDLANDYENLKTRLFQESEDMNSHDKLRHIFQGYIQYYYNNPDLQGFWSQMILFAPQEIREKFFADITARDQNFQEKMEHIFQEAMEKGDIHRESPSKMVMAFRAMREGLLLWMVIIPVSTEEWARSFWSTFWHGLQSRDLEKIHQRG